MKISNEYPPVWKDLDEAFHLTEKGMKPVITYGDVIFNPFHLNLTPDLIEHEMVHGEQQSHNPVVAKLWYQRYIADKDFRLEQETQAFAKQYQTLCKQHKDRNKRTRLLSQLAGMLSGEMYGSIVTHSEAQRLIRNQANVL